MSHYQTTRQSLHIGSGKVHIFGDDSKKSQLRSLGNACYRAVQNLSSFCLLSKIVMIRIGSEL
jgi:hypothetical protein